MIQGETSLVMPVMQMTGITKRFGDLLANDQVSFDLRKGEIHALVGENGAGKSTLMNILYGLLQPDAGEIHVGGTHVTLSSPVDALNQGIGMVHQHFMLVPSFSILENITLGTEPRRARLFDQQVARIAIQDPMRRLHLAVAPETPVGTLNVASQQKVEIAKVLYRGARIIVMDEPTAVLTPQETDELFILLRALADDGASIVFISHKLREVFALADRVTVLRNGQTVMTDAVRDTDVPTVVAAMTGRTDVNLGRIDRSGGVGATKLELREVSTDRAPHDSGLRNISLSVQAGEILGIAGVEGNGQSVLADVIVGTMQMTRGQVLINGNDVSGASVSGRRDAGLGYVPEDRQLEGLPINGTVIEGLIPGRLRPYRGARTLRRALTSRLRSWSRGIITLFAVKAPDESVALRQLSGGNQQKVVLGRELDAQPTVLVLAQPTRGVDLGAIDFIYTQIAKATEQGCAVLLISADLDEILRLSDRVLVLFDGEVVLEDEANNVSREVLGLHMTGSHHSAAVR